MRDSSRVLSAASWAAAVQRLRRRGRTDFDPFTEADARALGLPRAKVMWPPQDPTLVADQWSAARFALDVLRGRPDLHARFPHALSDGPDGPFVAWLVGDGGQALGLPPQARAHVRLMFAADLALRPRQLYFRRDDLRAAFPLGLLPPGRRGLVGWMLRHGCAEESLRLEEAWWFILRCAEDPAAELVRTYRFTPDWQRAHPAGLTRFGRDALAAWLIEHRGLPRGADWMDPRSWPVDMSPAEEIRLAYAANACWRAAHPDAFATVTSARAFLDWLPPSESSREQPATPEQLTAPGVNVVGHFCYPSGLRVSVEAMSDAMQAAGIAVSRRNIRTDRDDDPRHAAFGGLEVHDVTIIHTQPEPFFDRAFDKADLAPRTPATWRVAYWYWELQTVPPSWTETARRVDEIWTATEFVAEALRAAMPIPVHTMLPGVRIGPFIPRSREAFGLPGRAGRFAFLFSFHMASVMERKNPLCLIAAFRKAFDPAEPVDLILKVTSFGRHDAGLDALRTAATGANIHVLDRVLTQDETLSLIDACDAYVSLHRSEGLGLTMAEAMLLGKPVVATRYSGNLDFMDDGNSLLVDHELVPLGRPIPPYDAAGVWADPSVDHAARLMRRLHDNQEWAAGLGARARVDAMARFSPEAAGKRFAARLAAINAYRRSGSMDANPFKHE